MPIGAHLEELRLRLIRSIAVIVVAFIAAWIFRERILSVLFQPHITTAAGARISSALKFRDYTEPVTVQLKASLAVAIGVAAPYLLYQIWAFTAPGLFENERLFFTRLLGVSIICFAAGVLFGYFLFIPIALRFLLSLAPGHTEPMLMMGSYLSLFLMMSVALGIVFQTPLVVYYLVRWDIVSIDSIKSNRKNAVICAFILAAFFTPPDPATQVMMAVPVILLYELGILAAAPAGKTLIHFAKLAAPVILVVSAATAWYHLRPVARLDDFDGLVTINNEPVHEAGVFRLRRGYVVETGSDGKALLFPGLRGERESLALAPDTRVILHGSSAITLEKGVLLAGIRREGSGTGIKVHGGRVGPIHGFVEIEIIDERAFKVTTATGSAEVLYDGQKASIPEGRTRTFRPEDDAAVRDDIMERWGDFFTPDVLF